MNDDSFIPQTYKTGLIKLLLFQYFSLCSDFTKFHQTNISESILYKNSLPPDFVDKSTSEFLDKLLTSKTVVRAVPKKDLIRDDRTAIYE